MGSSRFLIRGRRRTFVNGWRLAIGRSRVGILYCPCHFLYLLVGKLVLEQLPLLAPAAHFRLGLPGLGFIEFFATFVIGGL